jgi:hypothetical protein
MHYICTTIFECCPNHKITLDEQKIGKKTHFRNSSKIHSHLIKHFFFFIKERYTGTCGQDPMNLLGTMILWIIFAHAVLKFLALNLLAN